VNTFQREYEVKYRAMRDAATSVKGPLLAKLVETCQQNPWLKLDGVDFGDGELYVESDYPYCLERYDDLDMLRAFFEHGNWALRAAVQWRDLIFVNQVNGGDEWWTLKMVGDDLIPFESITFRRIIACGDFPAYIARLHLASVEQCQALNY
jgi:hypothetical protein